MPDHSGIMSRMTRAAANPSFATHIIRWQKAHGRHTLPWQNTTDPYRIWLSEIMLQQTQVAAVMGYYARFLQRFPDVAALADAPQQAVMEAWSGLGYYSRARNLHKAAQIIVREHGGAFPHTQEALQALPGIGRSTAAAIAAFAFGQRAAICDGNVKRVLARVYGVEGFPGAPKVERELWALAESLLPAKDIEHYTQGLMDLGATLCTRKPLCQQDAARCPLSEICVAYQTQRTHKLPAPRPKKAIPEKHARLWIVRSEQGVWLEPRPPTGIWGGLLSLPQSDDITSMQPPAWINTLGMAGKPQTLEAFTHTFTHFKLHLHPVLIEVQTTLRNTHAPFEAKMAQEPHGYWVKHKKIASAALPAPIKKLLLRL
ncbi:MAG: A/G-specific adenine glycosylase [Burkholderiaceae bacterium]